MKETTPTRFKIAVHWVGTPRFVCDLGEPSCFACGYFEEKWATAPDYETRWNKAQLERAHIVPKSEGGSSNPDNFMLLCAPCHQEAPQTTNPAIMLRWATVRESWIERCINDALPLAEKYGEVAGFNTESITAFIAYCKHIGLGFHPHHHVGGISARVLVPTVAEFMNLQKIFRGMGQR